MTTNLRVLPGRIAALAAGAALALLAPGAARADKVFLKDGKVLDGIVQEEYESNIIFMYQGRGTKIPRMRIERIEKESGGSNIGMLIEKAEAALKSGDAEQAEDFLDKAVELNGTGGMHTDKLAVLEQEVIKIRAMGSPEERRKTAEKLVKEASDFYDKVEKEKGTERLLKALEADPTYEPAHELMGSFMRDNMTNFTSNPNFRNMARDYYVERVDLDKLKADHAIIDILPLLFEEQYKELRAAQEPKQITLSIVRLKKMSQGLEKGPEFQRGATDAQKALIEKGSVGIVKEQIESALKEANYEDAFSRLQALGSETESPELSDMYTRVYIGLQQFDKAKALLVASKESAPKPEAVEKTINALDLYVTAVDAMKNNNHKDARSILSRLFTQREELYPEIYQLVAKEKVNYDITEMEALDSNGDADGAANIAVRIFQYASATDKGSRKTAEEMFNKLVPNLSYKPVLVWSVDGVKIPTPEEWSRLAGDYLKSQFAGLKFNDASPFTMEVHVGMKSVDNAGQRVLDGVSKPQAFEIDQLEPDAIMTGMRMEVLINHAERPKLYSIEQDVTALPDQVKREREIQGDKEHLTGVTIFLNLTQLRDFFAFLTSNFIYYVPRSVEDIPKGMKLK